MQRWVLVAKNCTQVKLLLLLINSYSSRNESIHQNNYVSKSTKVLLEKGHWVVIDWINKKEENWHISVLFEAGQAEMFPTTHELYQVKKWAHTCIYFRHNNKSSVEGLITELQQTWTQLPLNRMSMSAENNKSSAFVSKCNRVEVQIFWRKSPQVTVKLTALISLQKIQFTP